MRVEVLDGFLVVIPENHADALFFRHEFGLNEMEDVQDKVVVEGGLSDGGLDVPAICLYPKKRKVEDLVDRDEDLPAQPMC